MSEETRLVVGQVLAGRYWLQEHLGRGQMGDVFRARHTKVPREFAIKVLHPELVSDPKLCARFEREAEVVGVPSMLRRQSRSRSLHRPCRCSRSSRPARSHRIR